MTIENELMLDMDSTARNKAVLESRHAAGGGKGHTKYLIKYFSESSRFTLINLRDIFIESKMRFSSRSEFNDPFDSYIEFCPPEDRVEAFKYFEDLALRKGRAERSARDFAEKILGRESWLSDFNRSMNRMIDSAGIICFAEDPLSMLMWSHYAESHRGVAVIFKVLAEVDALIPAQPVAYGKQFPRLPFKGAASSEAVIRALLYKAREWIYEYEWRLVKVGGAGHYFKLRPDTVCGIILGCNSSKDFVASVEELLDQRHKNGLPEIRRDRIVLNRDSFTLSCVEVL